MVLQKNSNKFLSSITNFFKIVDASSYTSNTASFFAEVKGYPLESLSGAIYFRILGLHDKIDKTLEMLPIAYPEDPKIYMKPVINNIVKIIEVCDLFYYTGIYAHTTNENNDFASDILEPEYLGTTDTINSNDYEKTFTGETTTDTEIEYPFDEIPAIKEKAGDTIIKGSANNDIILSYNENGDPIISIVLNRYTDVYNFNTMGIHLYGNENVDSTLEWPISIKDNLPIDEKEGSAIVLNTDKIRILAQTGTIFIGAYKNISFSSEQEFTIDNKKITKINSPEILLGKNATEKLVLGDMLRQWLSELIDALNALTVGTPVGPSSPPINVASFIRLKTKLNTLLSKQNKTL